MAWADPQRIWPTYYASNNTSTATYFTVSTAPVPLTVVAEPPRPAAIDKTPTDIKWLRQRVQEVIDASGIAS